MTKKLTQKEFPETKNDLPVKVVQFGEGNFMRAFVDWQIQQMNKQQLFNGTVAVVQPINQGLGEMLRAQDNRYTVLLEGLIDGELVETSEIINVLDTVINPYQAYAEYLALAENKDLEFVVSNTTEAGIQFNPNDRLEDAPQQSYPGKLTAFLYQRYQAKLPGLTIIPCELIDRNGDKLKEIVLRYIELWELPHAFKEWIENDNTFCCSLVDRIVPGYPRDTAKEWAEKLGYEDQLMVKAEPFMLWVIEGPQSLTESLPLTKAGLNVIVTDDMTPYRERKVHLLNGPHTAMVPLALLAGLSTVDEVMNDDDFRPFIDDLFAKELIPMLNLPKSELDEYADQIKERFLNPFAHHELSAISLNSVSKFKARLLPILTRYIQTNNHVPAYLATSLAALILSYRGDQVTPADDQDIVSFFQTAWQTPATVVVSVLSNTHLWGENLTVLPGLSETVQLKLDALETNGARQVVQDLKGEK
ncbi:tagaturonate reductase [Enterococcus aquimarinus]|uniref:Mannitol dehydrogenase domain protein n=1 Tax=Enterococcus aquimarinus TaxID=328396 RepID=A0A1L8QTI6_9ENTE|nr:tagaturonate reductase [Enterococcus aquimarinus]OJG10813.1 mannitol dehydrogenase domain protein [Enterococcus aquimarinus]